MISRDRDRTGELLAEGIALDRAMEAAYAATIRRHQQLGLPFVVWRDGQIAIVLPDEMQPAGGADPGSNEPPSPAALVADDPMLALAAFRIDVERRLRRIVHLAGLAPPPHATVSDLLRVIGEAGLVPPPALGEVTDAVRVADAAVHGRTVPTEQARSAIDVGGRILSDVERSLWLEKLQTIRGSR